MSGLPRACFNPPAVLRCSERWTNKGTSLLRVVQCGPTLRAILMEKEFGALVLVILEASIHKVGVIRDETDCVIHPG